jgi:2-C-methyl-D-erythritol 4-phosphate cytidylyltransferase
VWGIVLTGDRRHAEPAIELERLGAARSVDRAVAVLLTVCEGVVVSLGRRPPAFADDRVSVVPRAGTRAASVRRALAELPEDAGIVVVHDAVHPLATAALAAAVVAEVRHGHDAVVPVLALAGAVKRVSGGRITASVPTSRMVVAQMPQGFRGELFRWAHASGLSATDDCDLVQRCGGIVVNIPGEPTNLRVSTPAELEIARTLVVASARAACEAGWPWPSGGLVR